MGDTAEIDIRKCRTLTRRIEDCQHQMSQVKCDEGWEWLVYLGADLDTCVGIKHKLGTNLITSAFQGSVDDMEAWVDGLVKGEKT